MYTTDQEREIKTSFYRRRSEANDLLIELASRHYKTEAGGEYGKHGLGRRIGTLNHCVGRLFEVLPLSVELPSREALMDATVNVQAFCINVVGALDNLARLWLHESGSLHGRPIPAAHIGLGPKCKTVRATLPAEYAEHIATFDDWFDYVADYRHALAHRIPLYIPSRQYTPHDAEEYRRLDHLFWEAITDRRIDDVDDLEAAKDREAPALCGA